MDNIIQSTPIALPEARVSITIRPATLDDLSFMDSLQKKTTKQVGWMPTKQFEGKIAAGHVLIAVAATPASPIRASDGIAGMGDAGVAATRRVGYLIGNDQYFKHDDVGIIYQMNVLPEYRRSLVAASLLKAQFERSAYGCRLYCCWCAQDIDANHFWEAMGFVPLAFRAGSEKKARVHIFWQKRIRQDDASTPWWFPSKTDGGAIRADRIVLPIPHGTHWSDVMPLILSNDPVVKELNHEETKNTNKEKRKPFAASSRSSGLRGEVKPVTMRVRYGAPGMILPTPSTPPTESNEKKPKPQRKPKAKTDPRLISAARELRDRYLEQINDTPILPSAKYEVSRQISDSPRSMPLLAA